MSTGYNIGAKYEIVGRILHGTSVMSYMVKDRATGVNNIIEKGIVEQLALNRQVYNCNAQIYGKIVNMKGVGCKLNQLQKYTENGEAIKEPEKPKPKAPADLKIVGKVQNGRMISDYVIVPLNDTTKLMKIPKDTVIELALEGRILNAKVQKNNGNNVLRGRYGVNLAKLALYA